MDVAKIAGLIAKHRKLLIFGVIVVIVIYALSTGSQKKAKEEQTKGKGNISTEERLKADIEGLKKKIDQMEKEKGKAAAKGEEPEKGKKVGPTPLPQEKEKEKLESLKELEKTLKPTSKLPLPNAGTGGPGTPSDIGGLPLKKQEPPRLLKIDISEITRQEGKDGGSSPAQLDMFLPASSFASFTLTSSVYAPETGEQMPVSGVIDKAYIGPNGSTVPLRGCFLLGKARGNTGEGIADIKVIKLACIWPDGRAFEGDIAGYITDTNGDFGLKGRVERHAGTFFTTVGITSFLEGFAAGMSRAQEATTLGTSGLAIETATNIAGSAAKYGLLKGAADFATAAKQFFAAQLSSLVPAVVVSAGAKGRVFITSGVNITGGMSALKDGKSYYDSYNLSHSQ